MFFHIHTHNIERCEAYSRGQFEYSKVSASVCNALKKATKLQYVLPQYSKNDKLFKILIEFSDVIYLQPRPEAYSILLLILL